jgi:hypothetical protein
MLCPNRGVYRLRGPSHCRLDLACSCIALFSYYYALPEQGPVEYIDCNCSRIADSTSPVLAEPYLVTTMLCPNRGVYRLRGPSHCRLDLACSCIA